MIKTIYKYTIMKKTARTLIFTTALMFFFNYSYGYKSIHENSNKSKSLKSISEGCVPGSSSTFLELNNVRALIHTGGDMWWDLQGNASYEVPKGSGKMALFAGGIWIGGLDVNGQLRSAAVRYRSAGVDYWPGPLVTSGANQGGVTSEVCDYFDRHFVVNRIDVEKFRTWYKATLEGNNDILQSEEYQNYSVPKVFEEWPAHADALVGAGYDHYLAPFYDYNDDGEYDPEDGDYPFFDLDGILPCGTTREERVPRLYGDQTLWWVYNDRGNVHLESNGAAIGMEIRAQQFAFSTSDELNNMTFGNYALINRSTYTLLNTYFGVWTDADMGSAWDDYVGCDVNRGLGYLYNGEECDGDGNGITYGCQPPAVGVDFFEGPYQDADGLDNPSSWTLPGNDGNVDCNNLYGFRDANGNPLKEEYGGTYQLSDNPSEDGESLANGNINGLNFGDGVADNERWGMRRFIYFNNSGDNMGDPTIDIEYYYYLTGRWRDGSYLTFGGNGYGGSIPTDFMFPGSPTTDPCGWGTISQGVPPQGDWSEETENNTPYDRRFVQSAGPFTLEPGAVNDITVGMVWARASSGGPWQSVVEVQRADDKAQKLFENCFKVVDGPDAPELSIIELDKELIFHIYNKKGSNNYKENPEDYIEKDPFISCPTSDPNCDVYFRFEGYQVFQLKDKDVSVADLGNPDKAKLVFQCDIENYDENGNPIGKLINYTYDNEIGALVPEVMVDGKNEGIQHTFKITEDQFASSDKRLVNFKKYYYIAVAYAYNNYKTYSQEYGDDGLDGQKEPYKRGRKGFSGQIKTYEAIPHKPDPQNDGTILHSSYGDGPAITMLEGVGNGAQEIDLSDETVNIIMSGSPWKADSITYKAGYGPIDVKVVDPLNVKPGVYYLAFDSCQLIGIRKSQLVKAKWKLWAEGADTTTTVDNQGNRTKSPNVIYSDQWISTYSVIERRKSIINEQLIPDLGISITINQVDFPLDKTDPNSHESDGYIDATIEFEDESKPWLTFVPDIDGCSVFDWIKSGTLEEQGCAACNDYVKPVADKDENYENILFRTWAPYMLAIKDYYLEEHVDQATNEVVSKCTRKYGIAYYRNHDQINEKEHAVQSVDLVITSDKSKWTRSPVIEMCEYDTTGGFHASGLSENNTLKFSLRNHPSVDKDGNPDGAVDDDGDPMIGMGWFPGYAINVETGERLNIMFGEDSKFPEDNGRDLIWNPTSRYTTDLFINGGYGDIVAGDVVFGGKHVIYIVGHSDVDPSKNDYMPAYDEGKTIYNKLKQADPNNPAPTSNNTRAYVFSNVMWTGIPILNDDFDLLATDVKIRLRVASPYKQGRYDFAKANPRNNNYPLFKFDLTSLAADTSDMQTAKDALDMIRAVPNPYKGYSEYELTTLDRVVKFINLPKKCTISIYTVSGTLIRRFEKDNDLTFLDWDMKNMYGIDIASGVYIIHVEAPGIGEKVLKWFGAFRPIDLTTF
ncbi:MAG: hypothetical protein Kow0068_08760 [Marinilabiliales bacterium]